MKTIIIAYIIIFSINISCQKEVLLEQSIQSFQKDDGNRDVQKEIDAFQESIADLESKIIKLDRELKELERKKKGLVFQDIEERCQFRVKFGVKGRIVENNKEYKQWLDVELDKQPKRFRESFNERDKKILEIDCHCEKAKEKIAVYEDEILRLSKRINCLCVEKAQELGVPEIDL